MKTRMLRYAAISMATLGMGLGVAAAQTASIDFTGPDSRNEIDVRNDVDVDVRNDNDVDVRNDVDQDADSGNALVERNTEGGNAESGDAENASDASTDVAISNSGLCDCLLGLGGGNGSWEATIHRTGPDSRNEIDLRNNLDVDVRNNNDVDVRNNVDQDADSGDATVRRNTSGGDATTGSASNSSSLTTSVSISN